MTNLSLEERLVDLAKGIYHPALREVVVRKNPLLTKEQVNQLPNGTKIWVRWAGGNGPHVYQIARKHEIVYAASEWEIEHGLFQNNLDHVHTDPTSMLTHVWLDGEPTSL